MVSFVTLVVVTVHVIVSPSLTVVEEGVTVNVAFKIFTVLLVAIIVPLILPVLIFKILL